jgi:hypothetical protein
MYFLSKVIVLLILLNLNVGIGFLHIPPPPRFSKTILSSTHFKLESIWKKGEFETHTSSTKEYIQHLHITPQLMAVYYDTQSRSIRIRDMRSITSTKNQYKGRECWNFPFHYPIYDMDVAQEGVETLRIIASYFDRKDKCHCCFQLVVPLDSLNFRNSNSRNSGVFPQTLYSSSSPFRKVMVFSKNNISLFSIISFNGDIKTIIQHNKKDLSSLHIRYKNHFPISFVERDNRYFYLMNMENQELCFVDPKSILVPKSDQSLQFTIVCLLNSHHLDTFLDPEDKVSCFHVHWMFDRECYVTLGTMNSNVHVFHMVQSILQSQQWDLKSHRKISIHTLKNKKPNSIDVSHKIDEFQKMTHKKEDENRENGDIQTDNNQQISKRFRPNSQIYRVYADDYKLSVLGEDSHLRIFSMKTGQLWYTLPFVTDSYSCSFLKTSHQYLVMDGTEGIVIREIKQSTSPKERLDKTTTYAKHVGHIGYTQEYDREYSSERNTTTPKNSSSNFSYINFLMTIPVYSAFSKSIPYPMIHNQTQSASSNNTLLPSKNLE